MEIPHQENRRSPLLLAACDEQRRWQSTAVERHGPGQRHRERLTVREPSLQEAAAAGTNRTRYQMSTR